MTGNRSQEKTLRVHNSVNCFVVDIIGTSVLEHRRCLRTFHGVSLNTMTIQRPHLFETSASRKCWEASPDSHISAIFPGISLKDSSMDQKTTNILSLIRHWSPSLTYTEHVKLSEKRLKAILCKQPLSISMTCCWDIILLLHICFEAFVVKTRSRWKRTFKSNSWPLCWYKNSHYLFHENLYRDIGELQTKFLASTSSHASTWKELKREVTLST